ncbi:hypothetical protein Tco_0435616 [Tanacetum coccineum]|uniref:Uncharacterized protein n=1 Tax=Tanacetum coccineum TaxID=301880 RepID=A0ABQ4YXA7_9ASTR
MLIGSRKRDGVRDGDRVSSSSLGKGVVTNGKTGMLRDEPVCHAVEGCDVDDKLQFVEESRFDNYGELSIRLKQ